MASEAADALMEDAARQTDIPAPHASSSSPPSSIPAADGVDVSVRPSADDGHGSGVGGVAAVAGAAGYDDDEDSGGVDGAVDGDDDDDDEDGDDDDGDGEGGAGDDGDAAGALGKAKGGSKGGSSCHQCKSRRNFVALTYCTSNLDKKSKRCRKKFCGHCLRKFYHENPNNIPDLNAWKCPSCRKICCCAACRRRKQRDTTGDDRLDGHKHKHTGNDASHSGLHALYPLSGSPSLNGAEYGASLLSDPSHSSSSSSFHSSGVKREHANADDDDDAHGGDGVLHSASSLLSSSSTSLAPTVIPSPHFSSVLSSHIALLAEESAREQGETAFGRLYAAAKGKANSRKIQHILTRRDIKKERKVELIAQLLVELNS